VTEPLSALYLLRRAAKLAEPRVREFVLGSPDERAEQVAVSKAAWMTAAAVLHDEDTPPDEASIEHLARSLLENLSRPAMTLAAPGPGVRAHVLGFLRSCFAPLDVSPYEGGPSALALVGSTMTGDQVASVALEALTDNLVLWAGDKAHVLRDFGLQLQLDRLAGQVPGAAEGPIPIEGLDQAKRIVAWIGVETDPPRLYVRNFSGSPIYDIIGRPTMMAWSPEGVTPHALIFGAGLPVVRQLSPGYSIEWPLEHFKGWGGTPLVATQLHLTFVDSAGRKWLHAHDHVSQLPNDA
jgi:hypothetical protein